MCRMGASFPENLRQQKYPANTLAGAANTSPGPASRMGCAVAGPTCPPPSGLSTHSASCPPITGPTATPGHCIHPGDRLPCGEGGVNLWLTWLQDRTVSQTFTCASFGNFFLAGPGGGPKSSAWPSHDRTVKPRFMGTIFRGWGGIKKSRSDPMLDRTVLFLRSAAKWTGGGGSPSRPNGMGTAGTLGTPP